jgi:hypothetical protein
MAEFFALYGPSCGAAKRSHIRVATRLISCIRRVFNLRAQARDYVEQFVGLSRVADAEDFLYDSELGWRSRHQNTQIAASSRKATNAIQ